MSYPVDDVAKTVILSDVFTTCFQEMRMITQQEGDATALLCGMVRVALHHRASSSDARRIAAFVQDYPECASDCLTLLPLMDEHGRACFRELLIKKGLFDSLVSLARRSSPITTEEMLEIETALVKENDQKQIGMFLKFIEEHPDLSAFEKYKFTRLLRSHHSRRA